MGKQKSIYDGIGEALLKTDGSKEAAYEVLLKHFGGGVLSGLEALSEYASKDDPNMTALSAERDALIVSRQIMAPLLEARLQSRLATVEKDSKKKRSARSAG